MQRTRSKAVLNVYLVLKVKNQVLLSLRKNTGYFDNFYGLVAGHVEDNESAINALVREAEEEIGIGIKAQDLILKKILHRKTDRNNLDLFFEVTRWTGDPKNKEPQKCAGLEFFDLSHLPQNIIPYIESSLKEIDISPIFCESGWPVPSC